MSDEQPKGAPDWIVTFTDMMGLLLTFFILLFTFSTLEPEKFQRAAGSIQGAFRAVTIDITAPSFVPKDLRRQSRSDVQGMTTPPETFEVPMTRLATDLKKTLGEELDAEMLRQGYRIRIAADTLFPPGSAELSPACREALDAIAKAVAPFPNPLRVDGHTDGRFQPSAIYPSAWHLSAARAAAAARYLIEKGPIAPQRVSVAGYADLRPARAGSSDAQRARNRRIEITILTLPSKKP
jgi:chemotaxis protein MotB